MVTTFMSNKKPNTKPVLEGDELVYRYSFDLPDDSFTLGHLRNIIINEFGEGINPFKIDLAIIDETCYLTFRRKKYVGEILV